MALEIFKNDDEDILFGQDGNVFRTPYDFGNAFQNRMGLNNYILVPNIDLPIFTSAELLWINDISAVSVAEQIITRKGTNQKNYNRTTNTANHAFTQNSNSTNQTSVVASGVSSGYLQGGQNLLMVTANDTHLQTYCNAVVSSLNLINQVLLPLDTKCNNIIIGAIITTSTGIVPDVFMNNKLHRYLLYSRFLSTAEYFYYYNNKQGGEPQSLLNLEIDIMMQFAEVINISGVDQPCVRDYSGNNRHGIIMNLPAGTPQQKVDYANANLFVPFIS